MSESPLAAHLFIARQRAVGGSDQKPLSAMSPRIQRQYHRFAAELETLDDARAEVKQLQAELAEEQRAAVILRASRSEIQTSRDRLAEQVKRVEALADQTEAGQKRAVYSPAHAIDLAELRAAIGGVS